MLSKREERLGVLWLIIFAALLIVVLGVLLTSLTGCSGFNGMFGEKWETRAIGAQVNVADTIRDQRGGVEKSDRGIDVEITPTTLAAANVAGTQPVVVSAGDRAITAPPGAVVKVRMADAVQSATPIYEHNRSAIAQGSSLYTQSKQGTGGFDSSAPKVELPRTKGESGGARADGGESSVDWSNILPATNRIGLWVGGLAVACFVAAFLVWFFNRDNIITPLVIAALGLVLLGVAVVIDRYPWVLALASVMSIVLGVIWFIYRRHRQTLSVVAKAVEAAPQPVQDIVKSGVAARAATMPFVKNIISKAKGQP